MLQQKENVVPGWRNAEKRQNLSGDRWQNSIYESCFALHSDKMHFFLCCFVLHLFCFIAVLWQLHSKCHFESIRWHFSCCQKISTIFLRINSLLSLPYFCCFPLPVVRDWACDSKKNLQTSQSLWVFFYGIKLLFQHVHSGVTLLRRRARMEQTQIEMTVWSAFVVVNEGFVIESTNCRRAKARNTIR